MKEAKKIQKSFYFSDQKTKDVIEKRCSDLALINNQSNSFIIEDKLMQGLFPQDREAKKYVLLLYSSEQDGIKTTLQSFFEDKGNCVYLKHGNADIKPHVYYCYKHSKEFSEITKSTKEYIIKLFEIVVKYIEKHILDNDNFDDELFMTTVNAIKKNFTEFMPEAIFKMIYDAWEMIGDYSATIKFLGALISVCEFEETSESRCELVDIINSMPFSDK